MKLSEQRVKCVAEITTIIMCLDKFHNRTATLQEIKQQLIAFYPLEEIIISYNIVIAGLKEIKQKQEKDAHLKWMNTIV